MNIEYVLIEGINNSKKDSLKLLGLCFQMKILKSALNLE